MPTKIFDLELSKDITPAWGTEKYDLLYILVRYHGIPAGWVFVSNPRWQSVISAEQLQDAITEQMGWPLSMLLLKEQLAATVSVPSSPISLIVCTRDRTDQLAGCLQAILALDYPHYEVIIVDNAPTRDDTARLTAGLPVRYVREDWPGLDWARNRGIAEARHEILAFTDDDARPDRNWLRAIAHAFRDPHIMAVTGLIAPAELETDAQHLFEFAYGGMGKGFRRRAVRFHHIGTRELLQANAYGVGANMAFRREVFDGIGPFDVALDVGTPSGGGGDIEMFHRLIARGHTLLYEPSALVWHVHRRSAALLHQQIHDNGRSFGSYLLTCARARTVARSAILRFALWEWIGGWLIRRLLRPGKIPRRLVWTELTGALMSPFAYRAAQTHAKRISALPWSEESIHERPSVQNVDSDRAQRDPVSVESVRAASGRGATTNDTDCYEQ